MKYDRFKAIWYQLRIRYVYGRKYLFTLDLNDPFPEKGKAAQTKKQVFGCAFLDFLVVH